MGILDAPGLTPAAGRGIRATDRAAASLLGGRPLTNGSNWPNTNVTTENLRATNTRKRHTLLYQGSGFRLVYVNSYAQETMPANSITVAGALELTGSIFLPVYFRGARNVVIEPGGVVVSDPINLPAYTAGTFVWSRTWVSNIGAGQTFPLHNVQTLVSAWGEASDGTANTDMVDKTLSGTISGLATGYHPLAIVGIASDPTLPVVALLGDSITAGSGDSITPVTGGKGFMRRAIGDTYSTVDTSCPGKELIGSVGYQSTPSLRRIRGALSSGCTHAIDAYGINDLNRGTPQTLAALQAGKIGLWSELAAQGVRVFSCTLTPATTSTDVWATTVNQTIKATGFNSAGRIDFNNWLRDGAPILAGAAAVTGSNATGTLRAGQTGHPLVGYFETADTVETARDSGIWQVGSVYTTDGLGIHPSNVGHAAMAAAISPARFTV